VKTIPQPLSWLAIFVWFIFMGVTAVSYGFGALYPPLNKVAQPFVCPNGQMTVEGYTSHPMPGTTITQIYWYCVDRQSGAKTDIGGAPMHIYAGVFYGVLMFAAATGLWYWYNRGSSRVQNLIKTGLAVGLGLIVLVPMLSAFLPPLNFFAPPNATALPNATDTALAATFEALTAQSTITFTSTDPPLANWQGIPIMPQASAGETTDDGTYRFRVRVESGMIDAFYKDKLSELGWSLADSRFQGWQFTKARDVLLVIFVPASDLESWVVTLVRVP
jgi:hypothetical protein